MVGWVAAGSWFVPIQKDILLWAGPGCGQGDGTTTTRTATTTKPPSLSSPRPVPHTGTCIHRSRDPLTLTVIPAFADKSEEPHVQKMQNFAVSLKSWQFNALCGVVEVSSV